MSEDYNVFINTTNYDNTPLSLIEAMALGLPVVSTNVGGIPFLIDHDVHGLLVNKNDDEAMTNAIVSIMLKTEKAHKLVDNDSSRAEYFDWHSVKMHWLKLLSS